MLVRGVNGVEIIKVLKQIKTKIISYNSKETTKLLILHINLKKIVIFDNVSA